MTNIEKRIKLEDILGNKFYDYNFISSNYTPLLNSTITLTCTVTNVYGDIVTGKSIQLYKNGNAVDTAKTTNNNGVVTWTINCTNEGLQTFKVGYKEIEVFVDNKANTNHTHNQYLTSHQDISGKANISDLSTVATTGSYNDLTNKPNIPSQVTVDSSLSDSSSNPVENKVIKSALDNKSNTSHTHSSSDVTDNSAYTNIGTSANSTQKQINNGINSKLSEKAVASNVYSKSETYTKSEITSLISNTVSDLDLFEVVEELPSTNIKDNRLYLIVNDETITNNSYDIYLRVDNSWEQLDKLDFDIGNYYNKTEINTLLDGKVDNTDNRLTNSRTPTSHSHGDISNTGAIGSTANKPIITGSNGKLTTGSFGTSANTFAEGNHTHNYATSTDISTHNSSNTAHNDIRSSINGLEEELDDKSDINHTHTKSEITDFPTLHTVATSGSYNDLTNKPTIPNVSEFITQSAITTHNTDNTAHNDIRTILNSKADSSTIPTKTSDLTNDSNFLTSHQDISGKVDKVTGKGLSTNDFTNTYKDSLDNLSTTISNAVGNLELAEVVSTLPTSNIKTNRLYLVANTQNETENKYDIYLRVNNNWEKIDSLEVDITNYLSKTEASNTYQLKGNYLTSLPTHNHNDTYYTKTETDNLLDDKADTNDLSTVATTGNYNDLSNKPSIPSKTSDLTNDSNFLTAHQDITGKEDKSNKVSSWSGTTSDTHYPSEKLVKDSLDNKSDTNHSHSNYASSNHSHGNLLNDGAMGKSGVSNKNVVTNEYGYLTTEDKPSIPSKTSDLTNDSGFLTSHQDISGKANTSDLSTVATSGSYNDLSNKPSIPSDVSELTDTENTPFTPKSHTHTKNQITDFPTIPSASNTTPSADTTNGTVGSSSNYAKADHTHPKSNIYAEATHTHNSQISFGTVDDTSTSTVFTATVDGLTSLTDGTTVMLKNGVVTSEAGFTINVNGLGAKPVYSNLASATQDTTIFNINYTMLFVYDSTRVDGGCWVCYRGYDSNTNTIGYQIRTNSTPYTATDKGYRYRLWLETDDGKYMPVNTSTSTNATANRSSAMNTREFWIGGNILYNGTNGTTNANATMGATSLWKQYTLSLGYSFNNTGATLEMTYPAPVYMVAKPTSNGKARLNTPYYTQTLPSTENGLIYIYLGHMYSATSLELALDHPVYEYKNGGIRLYTAEYSKSEIDTLLNGKSDSNHTHNQYLTSHQDISGKEDKSNKVTSWSSTTTDTNYPSEKLVKNSLDNKADSTHNHTKNQITDFPTIPTKTSDLTNDSNFISTSSTNGLVKNNGTIDTNTYLTTSNASSTYLTKTDASNTYLTSQDISGKADTSDLGDVAFSNDYEDLDNLPTIPSDVSELTDTQNTPFTPRSHNHSINEVNNLQTTLDNKLEASDLLNLIYPIGSIYMSMNATNPTHLFGGNWWKLEDRFLLASSSNYTTGSTGGEATHTLTTNEMPNHTHKQDAHTHTQNPHTHTQNAHSHVMPNSVVVYNASLSRGLVSSASSTKVALNSTLDSPMGVIGATATNQDATATNQDATATNQDTGGGLAHNNMPPYLSVNMWRRLNDETYYNDGTRTSDLTIGSNVSVTVENGALKITTSTSGEKYVSFPLSLTSSQNFIFEFEVAKLGTNQHLSVYLKTPATATGFWVGYNVSTSKFSGGVGGSPFDVTGTVSVGDKFRIKQENGVISFYQNDNLLYSKSATLSGTYTTGFYTNSGIVQYIKNIKLIPL